MKQFEPKQFTPTKWDSAEQKAKFTIQFVKFVESDFNFNKFPKWFYQRLSNCFGNIAHFNQLGFYETYFNDSAGKLRFIGNCLNYPCYGDPSFTYSDVEKVIQEWLKKNGILNKLSNNHHSALETAEKSQLEYLKAKYETV